jgi:hypothetical protein
MSTDIGSILGDVAKIAGSVEGIVGGVKSGTTNTASRYMSFLQQPQQPAPDSTSDLLKIIALQTAQKQPAPVQGKDNTALYIAGGVGLLVLLAVIMFALNK